MNSSKKYNNELVKRANEAIRRQKMIERAHNRTIAWRDEKIKNDEVVKLRMAKMIAALVKSAGKIRISAEDIENADENAMIVVPVDDVYMDLIYVDDTTNDITEK